MSRARDLADLAGSANAGTVTGESLIINGDMAVSQRGDVTGINTSTATYGGADRFTLYSSSPSNSAVFSLIQQSVTDRAGFPNALRVDCTTAASGALTTTQEIKLGTTIEAQNCQSLDYGYTSPQKLTLSFWVKSNKTGTGVVWFFRDDTSNRQNAKTYTISSANTWEYKTITIDGDTTNKIPFDNGIGLSVSWILDAGADYKSGTSPNGTWEALTNANRYVGQTLDIGQSTSDYFDLTGVKLEVGSVATPFKHESYAENLEKCKRYMQVIGDASASQRISDSFGWTTTIVLPALLWPKEMRATPTFSTNDVTKGSIEGNVSKVTTNIQSNVLSKQGGTLFFTTSGLTEDYPYMISMSAGGYLYLDAEL